MMRTEQGDDKMRFTAIDVILFVVLGGGIFIFSLLSPTVLPASLFRSKPPEKVLVLDNVLSGYVTINEGMNNLLAVPKPAQEWALDGLLNHVYPELERMPIASNNFIPDPEKILYWQPDIVLVMPWQAELLKNLKLPRVLEVEKDYFPDPVHSSEDAWGKMGVATGKGTRVATLLDRYTTKRIALQLQLPVDTSKRKKVAYISIYNGEWWVISSSSYLACRLEFVGADNTGKALKFTAKADMEQLLLIDPDMIVFVSNPVDRTAMKDITGRPEFQSLRAVREQRTYKLPVHTFMNEPIEDPLLLTWMAEIIYPDIMPRRLREEYKETYQEVYHYSISDNEIDKAIYLDENRQSAGYDRFIRQEINR
jgi:iron complex transport system substrate-binding protein